MSHEKKLKGYSYVLNIIMANITVHHLAASSEEERDDWITALNEFIFVKPTVSEQIDIKGMESKNLIGILFVCCLFGMQNSMIHILNEKNRLDCVSKKPRNKVKSLFR